MKFRLIAILLVLTLGAPAFAHHSTAMYEMNHPVTVTGTVKRFEWTNPHAFIFLEVKDEKGNAVEWEVEMMSLNHLRGYGWTSKTVKPGDVISCTGGAAKSGAPSMISSFMKLGDGREMKS
jgi:DNA/RNA endonuclease YhcR with UshA esterase domain